MRNHVLIAPDSFKGTYSSREVAVAIGLGAGVAADICPVADGGEGTVETLVSATRGWTSAVDVHDPLERPCSGVLGWTDRETAVIEAASASGLTLLAPDERDAERATSRGTGELIVAAKAAGARTILLGVGGTASTDGGAGAIAAIDESGGLGEVTLKLLCDVRTTFVNAARIFAPQKGADRPTVERLVRRLENFADNLPRDPRGIPLTGAGGGLAGGLWARYNAQLVPGAQTILDLVNFDARLASATAVITGEGCFDAQTLDGKLVQEVITRAHLAGKPVHIVAGSTLYDSERTHAMGISSLRLARNEHEMQAAGAEIMATAQSESVTDGGAIR
ncbi:glycerate kinase family protein [Nocardia sp. CA-119907]|uniref:glycerate kinase family protein n=1 Tax=Nocardia sp. CA-119907 TaxID=3239973 RepID=UPI003D96BAB7